MRCSTEILRLRRQVVEDEVSGTGAQPVVATIVGNDSDTAVDEPFQGLALERRDWVRVVREVVAGIDDVAEEHAAGWACEIVAGAGGEVVEDLVLHCCCCCSKQRVMLTWLDDSVGGAILLWVGVLGGDVPKRVWRLTHRAVLRRLRFGYFVQRGQRKLN